MIIYIGLNTRSTEFKSLAESCAFVEVASIEETKEKKMLADADAFLIGPEASNPVKQIQKIFSEDKHLSIILFAPPTEMKQVKQAVQFAPFIGKNTVVVALNPELDLKNICESAATRTKQKRSFQKINLNQPVVKQPAEKIKLAEMGSLLEYAPIGALVVNEANRVVNYNQQAKKLFPSLLLIDVDLNHILSKKEVKEINELIQDENNPESRKEIQVLQKVLELTSTPVFNEEGDKHFLLLINDITSERQETKRIQSILEALPQMAWTANPKGEINYFTQGWHFYTGQTKEEAKNEGWTSVIHAEDIERYQKNWNQSVHSGKPFQQAARFKNNKEDHRWHLTRASAIKDTTNETTMWVGTSTDIHDQMLLTEELERKVKERTLSLEIANSELEQYAHVSSHDLQEPLRKIKIFAELLRDDVYENLNDSSKTYVDKISATAERMSSSLKSLLNFTKLSKKEKFVPVNLNEIVAHILGDLELMITQKNAQVEVENLPQIKAVPIQMQQLFYNLINNAIKFSKKDEAPQIKITSRVLLEEELHQYQHLVKYKEYHEIVVKDNGVGFEQKHAEKIFTIFQRLHTKTEIEGTGIGLSLVKKVVSNHGGEVYAKSEPGKGSEFHIILPCD